MNEFFKKLMTRVTALWAGWSTQQRIIIGIVGVVIIGVIIALFRVSATPVLTAVYDRPINDEAMQYTIVTRLAQENVKATVTADNIIRVADEATARRMRVILIRENLLPSGIDPWQIFDKERWTLTDMERNVNFQRAQQRMIADHIKAIEGVDDVQLRIVWPRLALFLTDQNPASAVVTIIPTPGGSLVGDRSKIEGIQKILQFAIEGLQPEHIAITDHTGQQLNDFEGLAAMDRQNLIERENKFLKNLEDYYKGKVLAALQKTFTEDRVRDLNIKIGMDMSKKSVDTTEHFPFEKTPRDRDLPYDNSERQESVISSEQVSETTWKGTGFNPEGPSGVEGQTSPAFKDMSNLYGEMSQTTTLINHELNKREIQEERSPQIDRVTVSVNIDGVWKRKFDAKRNPIIQDNGTIEREYIPIPPEDIRSITLLIQDAIGYNSAKGDSVTVRNIAFDRSAEFELEDAAYFRKKQLQTTILIFVAGLTLLLFGFMIIRMVSREIERRKRLAEEERARREQMMRESAMAEAEQEGMDVSISLEERTRMELMENAINLAKEHPEDAAQLIRTWLLEE
ncbi:MAG: flagellar M-ring protein FliF [Treponema sp.]|jgi:flagellar M-ring protein FliF|nr:flagellar M-ring protein FliF [Treponema sp.]